MAGASGTPRATSEEPGLDGRVERRPGEEIDRSRPVTFYFEGERLSGYAGDTVASALYASGIRIFTHGVSSTTAPGACSASRGGARTA